MNVMLFSRILEKTGVGNHINTLSDTLEKMGHQVIVVSGTQNISLLNENVKFIKTDTLSRNPFKVIHTIFHLRQIITENRIEIVHCHHRVASIYMFLYNLIFQTPYLYTLHLNNIPHDFFHRVLTLPGKYAIGVSTDVSNFLIEKLRIKPQRVVTVLNGVDQTKLLPLTDQEKNAVRQEWNIPQENLVVTLHSRIDSVKNHLLVVEAIGMLSEDLRRKVTVVCSGLKEGAYYNKVLQSIAEKGLENVFRFVGWVETRKILGIADFLFLPSFKEGFALNAAEAFFMKVPVARTKTAGFTDLRYCLPISSEEPEDMVAIISKALTSGLSEYQERVAAAYDFAQETLTCEKMATNTLEIYKRCVNDDV